MPGDFERRLVEHCVGATGETTGGAQYSGLFARWDGAGSIAKKNGQPWGLVRNGDAFTVAEWQPKISRIQGVLNDCLRLGRSQSIQMDMQDARKFGHDGAPSPDAPTLVYNRRVEAVNCVLWPLPGYHDLGLETFAKAYSADTLPFEQKRDVVAWRGNLAGRSGFHSAASGRSSHVILNELMQHGLSASDEARLERELHGLSRFEIVQRYFFHPDFDLGFTLSDKFRPLMTPDKLGHFCRRREPIEWFNQFKYVLCLSGYDTGSNFFVIANSGSVMFKEEDGWELFYSSAFRPWEHYIPIAVGGTNLEERLEWARSNTHECVRMSKASQSVCQRLADTECREAMLNGVLDHLK